MDTTKASFQITLNNITAAAEKLDLLPGGLTLVYVHNGAGHAPYVFAKDEHGDTMRGDTFARELADILPVFTHKYTRREAMAALEATERALHAAARVCVPRT